jgi:hypothetical protein
MTTTRIINKQAILLPAFLWYSWAVVNSSAALDVFWATEVMFDSILSVDQYVSHLWLGELAEEGCLLRVGGYDWTLYVPISPPCSWTIVPKSRKISLSS